jgi:hypothetical protein
MLVVVVAMGFNNILAGYDRNCSADATISMSNPSGIQ